MRPKVSVIIPTKNEEGAIAQVIEQTRESLAGVGCEIIVVDDSADDTAAEAIRAGARVIRQVGRGGVGEAMMQGFYWAKGDYIVLMDGDGTYDPAEIPKLLDPLVNDEVDVVNGDRFSNMEKGAMPRINRLGNRLLTWVTRGLFGVPIRDSQSGMKAFRRDVLRSVSLFERGFPICSEILAEVAKSQFRIGEVGISYKRRIGETKLNPVFDGPSIFWSTLKMVIDYRPLVLFGGIGMVFMIVGFVIAWPVIVLYVEESIFYQVGRALIATLCWLVGLVSFFTGFLLNAINLSFERIRSRGEHY